MRQQRAKREWLAAARKLRQHKWKKAPAERCRGFLWEMKIEETGVPVS